MKDLLSAFDKPIKVTPRIYRIFSFLRILALCILLSRFPVELIKFCNFNIEFSPEQIGLFIGIVVGIIIHFLHIIYNLTQAYREFRLEAPVFKKSKMRWASIFYSPVTLVSLFLNTIKYDWRNFNFEWPILLTWLNDHCNFGIGPWLLSKTIYAKTQKKPSHKNVTAQK